MFIYVYSFFSYFSSPPLLLLPFSLTAFVFWNDDRRDNYATEADPFALDEFESVGFPSMERLERLLVDKEPPFGTRSVQDQNIRIADMEKYVPFLFICFFHPFFLCPAMFLFMLILFFAFF